jgi:hypothetical protein
MNRSQKSKKSSKGGSNSKNSNQSLAALTKHATRLQSVVRSLAEAAPASMSESVRRKLDLAQAEFDLGTRLVDRDVKYFDTQDSSAPGNSGVMYSLSDMAQGQTDLTRIGDFVDIGKLTIHLNVFNYGAGLGYSSFRWFVVRWKAAIGSINDVAPNAAAGLMVSAFPDWDMRRTFDILAEGIGLVDAYRTLYTRDIHIDRPGPVQYEAGTTTANTGGISFIFAPFSDVVLHTQSRIEFTDV